MRKVFLADAHLKNPKDYNYRAMIKFLSGLKGNTEALYILGDLFEFWLGYKNFHFPHYVPVLQQLQELQESGVSIIYFEGNHDFHMGPFFEKTLQARIYRGPKVLSLDGKKVYICHGDQIISSDYGYRLLRFLMHNRLLKTIFPLVPSWLPCSVADKMGRHSKGNHEQRKRKWNYKTILKKFAAAKFQAGCDVVIAGHFHTPFLDISEDGKLEKCLVSLGDWINQFSYGEYSDGKFHLMKFMPELNA
jgi:UDP-2,3-diacylglucosamine hydrolase